jgi:hypothetical protein
MVLSTERDIVLISGKSHDTNGVMGELGRATTPESLHQKAEHFGVLQQKNFCIRIFDGEKSCIVPLNKLTGYHNFIK